MKCLGLLAFLLLNGGFVFQPVNSQCSSSQITILGNEQTLIIGVQQDLTCIYNGTDVASMEWKLVFGTIEVLLAGPSSDSVLVYSLYPEHSHNNSMFRCVVTNLAGRTCEQTITIVIKEFEHTLEITASHGNAVVAGTRLTLTCEAVTSRPAHLQWQGLDTSDPFVTASTPTVNGVTTSITLTFNHLKTSHSGDYNCSCVIDDPSSSVVVTYKVIVQIPPPTVSLMADPPSLRLSTGDALSLTCLVVISDHVNTHTTVETVWADRPALRDTPRVTIQRHWDLPVLCPSSLSGE
jgi:hypothetical protein